MTPKARPTTYKGIKMRSRLEAGYAAWLDHRSWAWSYEPQAFGNDEGQYLPDFRVADVRNLWNHHEAPAYIEVKPSLAGLDLGYLARRMSVIWDSEPEAHLLVQAPPPHESMKIQAGRAGLSPLGAVLDASAYVFSLVRAEPNRWMALTWIATDTPTLGIPLPVDMGPWAGDYWDVRKGDVA